MNEVSIAFEDLAQALRVLLEADMRANRFGLLQVDRAEAVGNIEQGIAGVFNSFHSLNDAMLKSELCPNPNWYETPELATILVLRNARHHNHAKKVRTLYSYYGQEAEKIGRLETYVLVDFPAGEDGGDTFDVYLSWGDLKRLFSMPKGTTRINKILADTVIDYLGANKFADYASNYDLDEERVFFNSVPLIVNAACKIVPLIKGIIDTRSVEAETYLKIFSDMMLANTKKPEINCGPIAYLP